MLEDWKKKYKEFCEWQKTPYQVNPMSEEEHICTTCGRHFAGNYCPQCGQSSRIGRYSFKKAFLLFLDVWGLGNRGMFRSIRDLFLRPGYMIRDYLKGMQMAYFPPFKMLFLLFALSLLVNTGVNIKGENFIKEQQERFEKDYITSLEKSKQAAKEEQTADPKQKGIDKKKELAQFDAAMDKAFMEYNDWTNRHETLFTLIFLFLIAGPLYLLFRHCPHIPDMRFSEFFVALIYITNLLTMISIIMDFFGINVNYKAALPLLIVITLKQLSGYSYTKTCLKTYLIFLFLTALLLVAIVMVAFIYAKRVVL